MATHLIAIIILLFMLPKLVDSLYGSTKGYAREFAQAKRKPSSMSVTTTIYGPFPGAATDLNGWWLFPGFKPLIITANTTYSQANAPTNLAKPTCKAYLQDVIVQWGFKNFTLDDRQYSTCPLCKHHVRVFKCAFANTWWNYRAVGNMDNDFEIPTFVEGKWRWADDRYHVFEHVVGNGNTESVVGKWDFLTIVVSEKDPR
ncbi:hypothetical protein BC936DRAFT_144477 [Jimgerdemannia flammicorona]|uniref:Uncharacterized protein n=1 Tax=Jimgerdemannia flammicorona TaxID=994334 RepID=A0A433DCF3_9FUNG|nr:hypothetical protein BC936DRAFT_144477 [Jimgerdemannia flammicorona]